MGEKESEPFQFPFDGFLKVGLQGSRVTPTPADLRVKCPRNMGVRLFIR